MKLLFQGAEKSKICAPNKSKILFQGAEAKISLENNFIVKDRIKKSYRIEKLDNKIRKLRTRSEAKLLEKSSKIIFVPKVIEAKENKIILENIKGKKLSDYLNFLKNKKEIGIQIGKDIAKLHDINIIHGDLTTSNMILKDKAIYFLDFGLGFISSKLEDKAVDLHLLKQALEAKHFQYYNELWTAVEKGYKISKDSLKVLERLRAVEKRGRYKH